MNSFYSEPLKVICILHPLTDLRRQCDRLLFLVSVSHRFRFIQDDVLRHGPAADGREEFLPNRVTVRIKLGQRVHQLSVARYVKDSAIWKLVHLESKYNCVRDDVTRQGPTAAGDKKLLRSIYRANIYVLKSVHQLLMEISKWPLPGKMVFIEQP